MICKYEADNIEALNIIIDSFEMMEEDLLMQCAITLPNVKERLSIMGMIKY